MPIVPKMPNLPGNANPQSPLGNPSPENLLMAAADMHKMGRLISAPESRPRPNHSLKVIK